MFQDKESPSHSLRVSKEHFQRLHFVADGVERVAGPFRCGIDAARVHTKRRQRNDIVREASCNRTDQENS